MDSSLTIVAVNRAATRLYRRRAEELVGLDFLGAFSGLDESRLRVEFDQTRVQNVPQRTEIFFPGLFAWHSVLVVPAGGNLVLLCTDVSDRARREEDEAVRASLRRIFEHLPMVVCITRGKEHRFDLVNAKGRALLGDRVREGERADVALPEAKEQGFIDLLDNVYESRNRYEGKALRFDWIDSAGQTKSGYFDVVYEPLYGTSGEVTGIVHLAVEVTEHVNAGIRQLGKT